MKKIFYSVILLLLFSCSGEDQVFRNSNEIYVVESATYVGKGKVKYSISTKSEIYKPKGFGWSSSSTKDIWDTVSCHNIFYIYDTIGALNPGDTLPFNKPKFIKVKSTYKLHAVDTTKYVKPVIKVTPIVKEEIKPERKIVEDTLK